tara:strand:+ start:537 stop:1484 length:948 start_codon:yes stop_codon:yes gene_type:complete
MFKIIFNLFLLILPLFAKNIPIEEIYLKGLITNPKQEISGMDWYNDNLFFLPENLGGHLFMISKNEIKKQISLKNKEPILPRKTKLVTPNYSKLVTGFDGLEAIAFTDDEVYITIEAENNGKMESYIVWGTIDSESYDIKIHNDNIKKVETPIQIDNLSYESIIIHKNNALLLYEANGTNLQSDPFQFLISLNDFSLKKINFPNVEYRITDATKINKNKFWVINYYWPGDKKNLNPGLDNLSKSKKADSEETIERLVEFKITNKHIELTNEEPISLTLESGKSRNWEGIVRFEESGFLIVTDKYPRMIFAYVNLN